MTQDTETSGLIVRLLRWWDATVLAHPWWVLLAAILACAVSLKYTADHLTINTNTTSLLSMELPFHQNRMRLEKTFPQDVNAILLLVEGPTPEQTSAAVQRLVSLLRADRSNFSAVTVPDGGAFFESHGLLYRDTREIHKLADDLSKSAPFLEPLARDPSVNTLLGMIIHALSIPERESAIELTPVLAPLREAFRAAMTWRPYELSWQALVFAPKSGVGITKRFVLATPVLDYNEIQPAEHAVEALGRIVRQVEGEALPGLRVRMTGETILEHEELQSVSEGTVVAGVASLILVCLTLLYAFRSPKLMFATFLTLTMGLVFSMAFATLAIGSLNLISIAFAVLFIGMGDAFSSHFCLRYRELLKRGMTQHEALRETFRSTGAPLLMCTLTAAIGLYAFIPTHYSGVSELGIIAGTSMFIAFLTTFTVLPALLKVMPLRPVATWSKANFRPPPVLLSDWPITYARPIRVATWIMAAVAFALLAKVSVDFNPINLRDQGSEPVMTFKYLLTSQDTSPMTLSAVARSEAEVRAKVAQFEKLPSVGKVVTLFDFIPAEQDAKLAVIHKLRQELGSAIAKLPDSLTGTPSPEMVGGLAYALDQSVTKRLQPGQVNAQIDLLVAVGRYLKTLEASGPATQELLLEKLRSGLLGALPETIKSLKASLQAERVTLDTLPPELKERWLASDGTHRIQIHPKEDLNDLESLREFIREAQQVDPDVTGLPVVYLESMNEVLRAFVQAFTIALAASAVLLLVLLRNWKDTLLVLLPLLLAAVFTAAATVVFDIPFNFANIIALPLLFGLGIDSGIHMVHRLHYLHHSKEDVALFTSSEAQGVVYGTLTTILSFSSLAFIPHQGTASMGQLLAIGLCFTLLCALVILPAFSALGRKAQPRYRLNVPG